MKTARRVEDIDPAFDPWEQSRPIPLFVLAIFIALAIWGALSYLDDLAPARSGEPGGLTADAPTPVQADAGAPLLVSRGNESLWSCASCHGARANESMRYIARQLSDADIETVARYYAGLPPLPGAAMALGASQARGEMLNRHGDWKRDIPACATCHGQNGEGVGSEFPRLAGQQAEYLLSQLAAWKGGQRRNSQQSLMDDIAARMSDDDMRAAAQYFGSLRP